MRYAAVDSGLKNFGSNYSFFIVGPLVGRFVFACAITSNTHMHTRTHAATASPLG